MESATLNATPTTSDSSGHIWKAQKRISANQYNDNDEMSSINDAVDGLTCTNQSKRFKCSVTNCESPINVRSLAACPKKLLLSREPRFQEHNICLLSPITEIAHNLSETTLNTPTTMENVTPLKGWRNVRSGIHKLKHFQQMLQSDDGTAEQDIEKIQDATFDTDQHFVDKLNNEDKLANTCFQMPRNTALARGSRRLNMDTSTLHEMAVDELSFYDDEQQEQQRSFTASPQLMGLLSPEGSPQRFQILEKPTLDNKFLQPRATGRQQKLQNAQNINTTSTTSSNTPAKSFRMFHSLSSGSMESSIDDEYMELFEMESLEQQNGVGQFNLNFPSDLNSLISGQLKSATVAAASPAKTPEMRRPSVRRCLSMTENHQQTPKTPELLKQVQETANITPFSSRLSCATTTATTPSCFKRPEPPSTSCSPVQPKRYRSTEKENQLEDAFAAMSSATSPQIAAIASRPPFRRYVSMNDAEIMTALARSECKDEPDLIGDFSKPYALPLMEGRHRDLKSISSETVARLLNGEFQNKVANYKIIDCRYPYEFEGGHIRGAKNLYTQEQILEEFLLTQQKTEQNGSDKRNIIIFHCEFSSERGPKLSRFLRNNDRERNTNAYPALDYPEIYLLHNGYKEFYETHAELCDPLAYRPMLEPAYNEAYRHFRAKSKSWNGDGLGGATSRLKKSRSRLML